MPTTKPRVQVTLEPETHNIIERLAALQGRTRGAVIADLIDSVAPAIGRTVALLEAALEAPEKVKQGLLEAVTAAHAEIASFAGEGHQRLDSFMEELSAFEVPADGVNPHVVTRGSGSGKTRGSSTLKKASGPATARVPAKTKPKQDKGAKDARKNGSI